MTNQNIQSQPAPDSPNNDAFEAIVELYYQTLGYITSAGKWFWVWDKKMKTQRGYQDIDVLAIGQEKTIIVSVSSSLDDKIRFDKAGQIKEEMIRTLADYFQRVENYLMNVNEYKWLVNDRSIEHVVAYLSPADPRMANRLKPYMKEHNICLLSAREMLPAIYKYVDPKKQLNVKIQNQMLRLVQIMKWLESVNEKEQDL